MFYVKNGETKIEIDYDNVYNLCPRCGREEKVDLSVFICDEDFDLCETGVCCEKCSDTFTPPTLEERVADMEDAIEQVRDTLRIIEKQNLVIITKYANK